MEHVVCESLRSCPVENTNFPSFGKEELSVPKRII